MTMRPLFLIGVLLISAAPSALCATPSWDYVYFPDTFPENAPAGAWEKMSFITPPDQEPVAAGGRLAFNLRNGSAIIWVRDATTDPRIAAGEFTFEWRQAVAGAGHYEAILDGPALDTGLVPRLLFRGFSFPWGVEEFFEFVGDAGGLDPALGKGTHTHRIVKRASEASLYVDGVLAITQPVDSFILNSIVLFVGDEEADMLPYEASWEHVAYARGAFTPEELPSPSGDTTAPAAVVDLRAVSASTNSITLAWTAPGDDASTGTARSYDVRFTTAGPITADAQFNAAAQAVGESAPRIAGSAETFTVPGLAPGTTCYFALKTTDAAGNVSGLSNSSIGATVRAAAGRLSKESPVGDHIGVVGSMVSLTVAVKDAGGAALADIGVDFSISSFPAGAVGQNFESSDTVTRADGKAGAVFRLGDAPADYEARCECTDCEPGYSTATFRACGKLTNTDFKQYDVAWSTHSYDDRCHLIGSTVPFNCNPLSPPANSVPFNIRERGCAMSAMADVLNYYRDRYSLTYAATTPSELNQYLRDNAGFDNGNVDFRKVGDYTASGQTVCLTGRTELRNTTLAALRRRIDADLAQGNPVVLRVLSGMNPSHFVIATGRCGGEYLIADPGHARTTVDPSQILGIREFSLIAGNTCPQLP